MNEHNALFPFFDDDPSNSHPSGEGTSGQDRTRRADGPDISDAAVKRALGAVMSTAPTPDAHPPSTAAATVRPIGGRSPDQVRRWLAVAAAILVIVVGGSALLLRSRGEGSIQSVTPTTQVAPAPQSTVPRDSSNPGSGAEPTPSTAGATTPPASTSVPSPTTAAPPPTSASTAPATETTTPSGPVVGKNVIALTEDYRALVFPGGDSAKPTDAFNLNDYATFVDPELAEEGEPIVPIFVDVPNDQDYVAASTCCAPVFGRVDVFRRDASKESEPPNWLGGYATTGPDQNLIAIAGGQWPVQIVNAASLQAFEPVTELPTQGFNGYGTLWLDPRRVLVLVNHPDLAVHRPAVYDARLNEAGQVAELVGPIDLQRNVPGGDMEGFPRFAGVLGDTFVVYDQVSRAAFLFATDGSFVERRDLGGELRSVWYSGEHLITVDADGVLEIDGVVIGSGYVEAHTEQ